MDRRKIKSLIKAKNYSNVLTYAKVPSNIFVFIFKERHTHHLEIIDMQVALGKKLVTNDEARTEYKCMLDDYNKSLKQGEYKRTYLKGYRKEQNVTLNKL